MASTLFGYDLYYAPDNTCKQTAYQVVNQQQLVIKAAVQNNHQLSSAKALDLFQSVPDSPCPFDTAEIKQISFKYVDSNDEDLTGNLQNMMHINSDG